MTVHWCFVFQDGCYCDMLTVLVCSTVVQWPIQTRWPISTRDGHAAPTTKHVTGRGGQPTSDVNILWSCGAVSESETLLTDLSEENSRGYNADSRVFERIKCGCWCRKHPHFTHTRAMLYSGYIGNTNKWRLFQFTATIFTSSLVVRPIHVHCTLSLVMILYSLNKQYIDRNYMLT